VLSQALVAVATPAVGQVLTERVSVGSGGSQGNGDSFNRALSGNGSVALFVSDADNLVPGDMNGICDVFVRDRPARVTRRVSVGSGGGQGNAASCNAIISGSGRFVAFESDATSLVPGDTNGWPDVFVRDLETGATARVSKGLRGSEPNDFSLVSAISNRGRFVVFGSGASNLVRRDTNGEVDVFVLDRRTGVTSRVSVSSTGRQGNDGSGGSSISADGRYVALQSNASNLVPGDVNRSEDTFVRDRATGTTTLVSVSSDGQQQNFFARGPAISADGRFVTFWSNATNLALGDTNDEPDVFVHDRATSTPTGVSVGAGGQQANGPSGLFGPSISAKGRFVAFESEATNLVAGDTNGARDVFVHDRQTGTTTQLSLSSARIQGNEFSQGPDIATNGRAVAFGSFADNLVPRDTNNAPDVFVRNR
jgi:Tol biopolymer transport system component